MKVDFLYMKIEFLCLKISFFLYENRLFYMKIDFLYSLFHPIFHICSKAGGGGMRVTDLASRSRHEVGLKISTKGVGWENYSRSIITSLYKHAEHSSEERAAFGHALHFGERPHNLDKFLNLAKNKDKANKINENIVI